MIFLLSSAFPIIPQQITAGEIAAFPVNLKLIGRPINELGKMHLKYREAQPAIRRIFHPASEPPADGAPVPVPQGAAGE